MKAHPGLENRRSPRRKHDSVLELFDDSGQLITAVGRLVNVSAVGMCFSSTKTFHRNDRIQGRLRLLKQGVLLVKGHVVWARRTTNTQIFGVAFDDVRPDRRRHLQTV